MTKKAKKIFNLIIVLIVFLLSISSLQVFTYAIDPDLANGEVESTETSDESEETEEDTKTGLMPAIRNIVSQWYYIFRYFSIVAMLIVLIYLGIKMAITSSASDKAQYKRMLMDWVVGFAIIFCIHYFMILVLKINTDCVDFIKDIADAKSREIALTRGVETCSNPVGGKPCYACDACKKVLESNSVGLYETIRTRAYEFRLGIGTSGMIMYMVLVYYTIRFAIIYFKRFFTVMILTIIAPLVGLSYAFTKVTSGKAPILSKWAQEYCFNVFLQTIHALIYTVFVTIALMISTESIAGFIIAMIMLNFMIKADKIFRKIFKFSGSLLDDNADKDMKENFAALTAIKASTAAVLGGAMAKDAGNAIKSGAGAIGNLGARAGFMAYNKVLKNNDSILYDKKQESEKAAVELNDSSKTEEEKQKIRERKKELDEEIAAMEARRNRMKNYTENIQSSSETGQYFDKKNQVKRDEKIKAEVDRRIQKRNELGLKVDDEEKKKIELEVKRQINKQVKKRNVYRDEKTGEKEIISSVGMQLKRDINKAIWGNDAIKSATKNMVKGSANKIMGNAMIFAAIPLTVANPKVGLALLGKGIHSSKSSNEFKKVATFGERRRLRKSKKVTLEKEKNKKYTFGRFSKPALKSIQAKQRMKEEANIIRKINSPSVSMKAFSLPLRMIGVTGAVRSAMAYQYKVDKAKRKYYQNEEASYAVATKDSVNKDFIRTYDNLVYSMESKHSNMTFEEAVLENKKSTGQVYEIKDTKFEFKQNKKRAISTLTDSGLIDIAILNVAAKNNIVDLNEVNFTNKVFQSHAIEELSGLGLLTNEQTLDVDQPSKELTVLFKKLETRKKILVKKSPELAKEKFVQLVTSEYMKDNEIDSAEEVKKEEHAKKIKEIVFERIEERKLENKTETDIFQEKMENIVERVMVTTDDETERKTQIEEEVRKLFTLEESTSPILIEITDELKQKREKLKGFDLSYASPEEVQDILEQENITLDELQDIINYPEDIIVEPTLSEETIRVVDTKTAKVMDSLNIEEIISSIKQKDKVKQETESFIDKIISSVEEVKDVPTLTKEEEKIKNSPQEVKEFIKNTVKKKVRTSEEFVDLNEELRKFDSSKTIDEMTDEYVEENSSGKHDELISNLIASMQEDKVLVDIKVTKPTDKRVLTMKYIDKQREKNTYNKTNIEDIIKNMESKKTINNK